MGRQLGPQRLEQAAHRELGRCVRGVAVDPDQADVGGDADDRARPPLDHAGHDLADRPQRAEVVDVDHLPEHLVGELLEVAGAGDAGAAHEDVDRRPGRRRSWRRCGPTASRSDTSSSNDAASAPRPSSSATAASSGSGRRATTVTRAPLSARATAVARPMPLDPPVISAWRPAMLVIGPTLERGRRDGPPHGAASGGSAEGAGGSQLGDAGVVVAEHVAQHLVGVLADGRRHRWAAAAPRRGA